MRHCLQLLHSTFLQNRCTAEYKVGLSANAIAIAQVTMCCVACTVYWAPSPDDQDVLSQTWQPYILSVRYGHLGCIHMVLAG